MTLAHVKLEGCEPAGVAAAVQILASEAGIDADGDESRAIAGLVGCEPRALRWAGQLARTTGWCSLRGRLASWAALPGLAPTGRLPWAEHLEQVVASVARPSVELLAMLAASDAPVSWDVLEAVARDASVESLCELEERNLLARETRAGVVMFRVPYCVRAAHRLSEPDATRTRAARWLQVWLARATELRGVMYGASARATLTELACAIPLAERAILDDASADAELAVALWTGLSDAMFFEGAADYASPAFERAVARAGADADVEIRVRVRTSAARAALERGDPARAERLLREASEEARGRADLVSEISRGEGWAELACAKLVEARSSFERARDLSERAGDPRGQADATSGLGVLALLTGSPEQARDLLGEALATHVVTRDAPREAAVRGMMALLPDAIGKELDVSRLSAQIDGLRPRGQRWREALVLARVAMAARDRGDAETARERLAEARAAAALSSMSASKLVSALVDARGPTAGIVVGFEGRTLTLADGAVHDLGRHGPLRRMLWALAVARSTRPGVASSTLDLVGAAWPGEKMKHEAATLRVYTTIRRLRAMGLEGALVTRDEGYLFDPDVTIEVEQAPA